MTDETQSELQSIHFQVLTELGVESVVTFGKPAREFYRNHYLGPKVLVNNDCSQLSIFTSKTRFATPDDCAKLDKMLSLILNRPSNIGASLFEENGVGWKIRQDQRALTQFGGILESQKQRNLHDPSHPDNNLFGGPNESQKQRNLRDPSHPDNILYGGPNESQKQRNTRLWNSNPANPANPDNTLFGGPNESQKQRNTYDPFHPDNILFGGPNESLQQLEARLWNIDPVNPKNILYGGPNVSQKQVQRMMGGPDMNQSQTNVQFGGSEVSDLQLQKRELHAFGGLLMTERQKDRTFGSGKETENPEFSVVPTCLRSSWILGQ